MAVSAGVLLPVLLVLGAVLFAWLFFQRRQPVLADQSASPSGRESFLDLFIVLLCFAGLFLFPMHLRHPLLSNSLKGLSHINFPCVLAVLLSLLRLRRLTVVELLCFIAWLLLLIPLTVSNRDLKPEKTVTAAAQNLLPLFLVLFHMEPSRRRKTIGIFVLLFDCFILLLLVCGLVERFTDHALLRWVVERMQAGGLSPDEYVRYLTDHRFSSFWGHPLTNALFFNGFYALNILYLRSSRRHYLIPLLFVPSLIGILLCSSKTGIVICFSLFLISCWKYKKWFLLCIPVLLVMYFAGAFNGIIARFSEASLTTGRLEDLEDYLASGISPFRWLSGYGTNVVLSKSNPVNIYNDAFEFSPLMYAFDYGILFSVVHVGGLYAYVTWRLLRMKHWTSWLCFSALFAQICTYNGYALRNQDVCFYFCFLTLMILNISSEQSLNDRQQPADHAPRTDSEYIPDVHGQNGVSHPVRSGL